MIRPEVAGIDLGSQQHWVCAPSVDRSVREVATFGATTPELLRMAQWLRERHIASIAMESTGVYWIAPHEVLEAAGFEILLVDTRQFHAYPGGTKKRTPKTASGFSGYMAADFSRAPFALRKPYVCCGHWYGTGPPW